MAKYYCNACGQTFESDTKPTKCPICGADASMIEEVKETADGKPAKKGFDTNSNTYTIIYASCIVILVAFLLAFVSSVLKPAQDANVAIDKKSQILAALNVRGLDKKEVIAKYDELIVATEVYDAEGNELEGADAFDVDTKELGEKYPIYEAKNAAGEDVTVICMKGRGLWGGLWGYMAIDAEGTVTGAYFNHESETAGLGALIKEQPFQDQFIGRKIGDENDIQLTVVKKGAGKTDFEVDGVTGATLTSKGVGEMVNSSLKSYMQVLVNAAGKLFEEAVCDTVPADSCMMDSCMMEACPADTICHDAKCAEGKCDKPYEQQCPKCRAKNNNK